MTTQHDEPVIEPDAEAYEESGTEDLAEATDPAVEPAGDVQDPDAEAAS